MRPILVLSLSLLPVARPSAQQSSIVDTKHNLSASGPGEFKALTESQICIFCHTPHRARTTAPLWNREDSRETYLTYSSSTFGGIAEQPGGSSKLCLSCHDGSIALGAVVSRSGEIEMASGRRFLRGVPAALGTFLSDDHPVSFDYASSRGGSGVDFVHPSAIPEPVTLDPAGAVQCTSCHEPHDDTFGHFLRATDRESALCRACHAQSDWPVSSHANSPATWSGGGADPWPHANYDSVRENACANCHVVHGAEHPTRLLSAAAEEDTCLRCHDATVAAKSIEAELVKPFRHDVFASQDVHDPTEDPRSMTRHVECQDCHEPHSVMPGSVAAPGVPGPLNGISGVDGAGNPVEEIQFGFQLCYKCHSDVNGGVAHVARLIQQTNTRLEFDPSSASFHPVEAPGRNPNVPSLRPPYTESSRITCFDCHASDSSPAFGGTGPAGPHGSSFSPILGANYETSGRVTESPQAYALCYRCHNRSSILDDRSFKKHEKHIVDERIPCSACHDAHGISSAQGNATNNAHLINFDMTRVQPSNGQLFFRDDGDGRGTCMLICHGMDHDPKSY